MEQIEVSIFESREFSEGRLSADIAYHAFLSELREFNEFAADSIVELYGLNPRGNLLDEALQDLFSELNESAPPGYVYHAFLGEIVDVWESRNIDA